MQRRSNADGLAPRAASPATLSESAFAGTHVSVRYFADEHHPRRAQAESPGAPTSVACTGLPGRSGTRKTSSRSVAEVAGLPGRSGTRKTSSRSVAKVAGLPGRSGTRKTSSRSVAKVAGLPGRSKARKAANRSLAKAGAPAATRTRAPRLRRPVVGFVNSGHISRIQARSSVMK